MSQSSPKTRNNKVQYRTVGLQSFAGELLQALFAPAPCELLGEAPRAVFLSSHHGTLRLTFDLMRIKIVVTVYAK
jgi:hypothetical protein